MFQPQPTPFASASFSPYGVPQEPVVDYSFAPSPLTLQLQSLQAQAGGHDGGFVRPRREAGVGAGSRIRNSGSHRQATASTASAANLNLNLHLNALNANNNTSTHGAPLQVQIVTNHADAHANAQAGNPSLLYSASSHASTSSSTSPIASSSHSRFSPVSASSTHHLSPFATQSVKMDTDDSMQDELAAQEAAAREYQPQLEGPLVGERTPSQAITQEYAKADQVYVEKTIALPQTYSHYRPIQGDGNCGWRAIGFSYFETLIQTGDQSQIDGEVARITSFNQLLLNVGGYDRYLFEDMVEETITLLKEIANTISNPAVAMAILTQKFNDPDSSNAIIYHMRLMASSWLKGDPAAFEPFIPEGLGISGYCSEFIERVDREIEQLGIMLLVNVLLKQNNFVLEIAYLDRSPGSQVNVYRFPEEANGQNPENLGPIIYLLYRPDHYDILYRGPLNLEIHRATSYTHHELINSTRNLHTFSNVDFGPLGLIPGFSAPPPGLAPLDTPAPKASLDNGFGPSSPASWMTQPFPDLSERPMPQQLPRAKPQVATSAKAISSTPNSSTTPSPVTTYPLRFSSQFYKLETSSFPEPAFTTAMFKNSHYNKAHYNNPHFHPEEWSPDDESPERGPGRRRRHKTEA